MQEFIVEFAYSQLLICAYYAVACIAAQNMNKSILLSLVLSAVAAPVVSAQDSSRIADQLPITTQIYIQIPDCSKYAAGFEGSSIGRIWSDPEVQAFLEPVLPFVDMGLMQASVMLQSEGLPASLLDFSQWDNFEIGFGLTNFNPLNPLDSQVDMVAAAAIGFKDPAIASQLFDFLYSAAGDDVGATIEELADGRTMLLIDPSDTQSREARVSVRGNDLTVAITVGLKDFEPLSGSADFTRLRAANTEEAFMYMNLKAMTLALDSLIADGPAELTQYLSPIMDAVGLDDLGHMAMSYGWKDGDSVMYGSMTIANEADGLVAMQRNAGNADLGLLEYIPPEATKFSIANADMGQLWKLMELVVNTLSRAAEEQGSLAELEQYPMIEWLSGDKQARLGEAISLLGPRMFSWSVSDAGALMGGGGGSGGTYTEVRNVAKVRSVMTELVGELEGMSTPESVVTFRVKNVTHREKNEEGKWVTSKGAEYYEMRLNNLDLPGELAPLSMLTSQFTPTWAITDDGWMVFATKSAPIRKALRDGVKPGASSIRDNEDVKSFLARLPENPAAIAWSDPRPLVGGIITMAQSMLPMLAGSISAEQMPLDLNKFPGPDAFTKHLRTSESWTVSEANAMTFESVGSVGLGEVLVSVIIGAVGLGTWMTLGDATSTLPKMFPTPFVEANAEPSTDVFTEEFVGEPDFELAKLEVETISSLARLQGAIMVFQLEHGGLPSALDKLNEASKDWPTGFLTDGAGVGTDAWGQEFVYLLTGDGAYQLYSCGPDGYDNKKGGDDIALD